MRRDCRLRSDGFTLIEVLVVIAIILLLAALMFPALMRMRDMGYRTRSVSNLRQLHTAAMSYASDHGGHLPWPMSREVYTEVPRFSWSVAFTGTNTGWVAWAGAEKITYWWDEPGTHEYGLQSITNGSLFKYVGDAAVYVSPLMERLVRAEGVPGADLNVRVRRSYGMNARLYGSNPQLEHEWRRRRVHEIENPSRKLLFGEQGFEIQSGYTYSLRDIAARWDDPIPAPTRASEGRRFLADDWRGHRRLARNLDGAIDQTEDQQWEHIGEYNAGDGHAVFVDGHVERVPYTRTRELINPAWD